eukprot:314072-Prorocentrum_minimum.AAC.2
MRVQLPHATETKYIKATDGIRPTQSCDRVRRQRSRPAASDHTLIIPRAQHATKTTEHYVPYSDGVYLAKHLYNTLLTLSKVCSCTRFTSHSRSSEHHRDSLITPSAHTSPHPFAKYRRNNAGRTHAERVRRKVARELRQLRPARQVGDVS